ncbi:MAG TPA: (d)CMP kinase, partial [Solirubrobacteraceae bacterium]|nr:(d)CMP kinase [Solirubrobacteraceae bacterium]
LDSGAMYRCVALLALALPAAEPAQLARAAHIALGGTARPGPTPGGRVLLDARDVTDAIRSPEVSEKASQVAADPEVREVLVAKQRELIAHGDWVAEGRDIGTVVAPDAELKVFLTADAEERARRRALDLGVDPGEVHGELSTRDERDSTRAHSPLEPAPEAVVLDTTGMSVGEVVQQIAIVYTEYKGPADLDIKNSSRV